MSGALSVIIGILLVVLCLWLTLAVGGAIIMSSLPLIIVIMIFWIINKIFKLLEKKKED